MLGELHSQLIDTARSIHAHASVSSAGLREQLRNLEERLRGLYSELGESQTLSAAPDSFQEIENVLQELDAVRKNISRVSEALQGDGSSDASRLASRPKAQALEAPAEIDRERVRSHLERRREKGRRRTKIAGHISMEIIRELPRSRSLLVKPGLGDPAAYAVAERLLGDGFEVPVVARKVNLPIREVARVHEELLREIRAEIEKELAHDNNKLKAQDAITEELPPVIAAQVDEVLTTQDEAAEAVVALTDVEPITLAASSLEEQVFVRRQVVL